MQQSTWSHLVSEQLIQHLVTSNPSPAYVERVSSVFSNNGSGVRGEMRAVLIMAILTDAEARAGDDPSQAINSKFGHMREPILFLSNLLRGLNRILSSTSAIYNDATELGGICFNEPSVFSYFSPQNQTSQGLSRRSFTQIYSTQSAATYCGYR